MPSETQARRGSVTAIKLLLERQGKDRPVLPNDDDPFREVLELAQSRRRRVASGT